LFCAKFFGQREIIIKRVLIVDCPNPNYLLNKCDYALLVPANRPGKQEILEYKYSIKPEHVIKTEDKEYYIKWKGLTFSQLNKTHMEVSMKIKIKTYDLKTAKQHPVIDVMDLDTLNYLKDEENFRYKSKSIKEVSGKITGKGREEIVQDIFYYVAGNLDYHIYFYQDRGAKQALKDGKGDCTEYSELMVTLCRAKKIPARIVMGMIPKSNGEIGYHNWVEVFFQEYGWVAFDPTWADHPKATTTFYSMKNTYVELSNKRFIKTILCPCYPAEFPFSIKLRDTCIDLSKNISAKIKEMKASYNVFDLSKTASLLDTLLTYEPDNYGFWLFKGVNEARLGKFDKGLECLQTSVKNAESNVEKNQCYYAFANLYAIKGDGENAVKYLREAISLGFENYDHIAKDADFNKIKDYLPFIELQNQLKALKEQPKKEH